jgi:hypothetical protein
MKTLTVAVAEALIALGNGEKVTSDYLKDNEYMFLDKNCGLISIMGGVENYDVNSVLVEDSLRIYEEFTYPMWFENKSTKAIVKFSSLKKGVYVTAGANRKVGEACDSFISHTDVSCWQQVEEPKKMIKVAKYAFVNNDCWGETANFYKDDADFIAKLAHVKNFKRLDYTEIEVEDYE